MKYDVRLPQLTETMEEGIIANWFKEVGDHVVKGETLFAVETDKAIMEVEAVDAGYLCEIRAAAGVTLAVGSILAVLADSQEEC